MNAKKLPVRIGNTLKSLAKINSQLSELDGKITGLYKDQKNTNKQVTAFRKDLQSFIDTNSAKFVTFERRMKQLKHIENSIIDLERLYSLKSQKSSTKERSPDTVTGLMADNHIFDRFYLEFENRFRGTEELIYARQKKDHLQRFKSVKNTVIDIGCGRGEFLQLLKDNSIDYLGIDLNENMINDCIKKGLRAQTGNAMDYLDNCEPATYGAITGFHIVEHIPFEELMKLFKSCYRALTEEGFVLFETPNPENLIVGACQFYYDPSHLRPIPPAVLSYMLEFVGFETEIVRLHPIKEDSSHEDKMVEELAKHVFGPMDYAVIGKKM